MRCLVTGADGFIGANLCRYLRGQGHEVVGAALNRKGETSLDALGVACRVEYGDVTDADYVGRIVNATEPEWVFHLAAVSIVRIAQASPARCLRTNILGTVNVLEACRQQPTVRAVVVASSDKAYGFHGYDALYFEDMALRPTAPYEVSKASADLIAQMYGRIYGLPAMVIRAANVFGPGDLNWSRLVPNSCRLALRGEAPVVHADAWAMQREWIDVGSVCRAYEQVALEGAPGEAYNCGSGVRCTAGEMAGMVALAADAPAPQRQEKARAFAEILCQALDSTKLRRLGWSAGSQGLVPTVEWYRRYLGARVAVPA